MPGINKIVLKDNELFAILDDTGESPRIYDRELGFYFRDTRYLDTWELNINGNAATALSCEAHIRACSYVFVMTNKDIVSLDYDQRIPRDRLKIERIISLDGDQVIEQVEIKNYDSVAHGIEIDRRAGSRFHDIFEVRGMRRERRGQILAPVIAENGRTVTLGYEGLDGKHYSTSIWFSTPADHVEIEGASVLMTHRLRLAPREALTLKYVMSFDREPEPMFHGIALQDLPIDAHLKAITEPPRIEIGETKADLKAKPGPFVLPKLVTDNALINRVLSTAGDDIAALLTHRNGALYPDAGIPWFCAPFGRDGLITAYQMLPWCPDLAEGVLEVAFSTLGRKNDAFTDEEPGKVFHENRFGEMARLREIPFIPYYGSVDSTPLALILLGEYAAWTRRLTFVNRWWEPAMAALGWVRDRLRSSPSGFLTYQAGSKGGLRNQGWKDSHDSVMYADGRLAEPPIALCEAQAYAYRALRSMARVARELGHVSEAEEWNDEAEALRVRFKKYFWDAERGSVSLALDGENRPCRVMSSNMGHCLFAGILDDAQAAKVATQLLSEPMFSGHGIRTLATKERAYNPLSYHNGSVWPHDNAIIAEGLRSYDRIAELLTLSSGLFHVAEVASDFRLPELFCGFPRYGDGGPVPYDVACKPQAWAAGSPFLLLKALLGMHVGFGEGALIFRSPMLPPQIRTLEIQGLRVTDFEIDLLVRRGTLTSTIEVLRTTAGPGRIIVVK